MLVVDDLLLFPAKGLMAVFKRVAQAAEEELTDDGKVKEELLRLQMLFETDKINQEEYERQEDQLMKKLQEIREYKSQQDKQLN